MKPSIGRRALPPASFGKTIDMLAALHVPCAMGIRVVFKRHFSLRLCKVVAGSSFLNFYTLLECAFAEIEEVVFVLFYSALRTPASQILSPYHPQLQAGGIIIALARRRLEASWQQSSLWGSFVCCRPIAAPRATCQCLLPPFKYSEKRCASDQT